MSNPERGSHIHDEEGRIEDPNVAHQMARAEKPYHETRPATFWESITTDEEEEALIKEQLRARVKVGERKAVEVGKMYEQAFRAQKEILEALKQAAKKQSPAMAVRKLDYTDIDRLQIQVDEKDPSYPNTPGMERPVVQVYIQVLKKGQEISVHHGAYGKDTNYSIDQVDRAIEDAVGAVEGRIDQAKQAA